MPLTKEEADTLHSLLTSDYPPRLEIRKYVESITEKPPCKYMGIFTCLSTYTDPVKMMVYGPSCQEEAKPTVLRTCHHDTFEGVFSEVHQLISRGDITGLTHLEIKQVNG